MRANLLAGVVILALSTMAVAMIWGDGPGSGNVLIELSSTHGINRNDVPVIMVWLVGVSGTALLWWQARGQE